MFAHRTNNIIFCVTFDEMARQSDLYIVIERAALQTRFEHVVLVLESAFDSDRRGMPASKDRAGEIRKLFLSSLSFGYSRYSPGGLWL